MTPEAAHFQLDWLKKWAVYSPRKVAFKDAETSIEWTFAELYYLSCQVARLLASDYKVKEGDRVCTLATNSIEAVALFFAIQRLGAIFVPINFRLTAREIDHIICDSEPRLLIYQQQFARQIEMINNDKRWPCFPYDGMGSLVEAIAQLHREFCDTRGEETVRFGDLDWELPFSGRASTACMILYTSGTTGAPKGAILTNSMLHWNSINTALRLNITPQDCALSFLPFFHTGGWNVLLTPFVHWGAKTVIMKKFDPDLVLSLAERERATILFGVPTTLDMMYQSPSFAASDLSSVRFAIVGGEPMGIDLIRAWQQKGIPVRQGFGMTEFGPNVFSLNEEDSLRKIGSIGFPNFYIETRIVDDFGHEVEVGEIGELLLRGPVCMQGYWRNSEATQNSIRSGWFYTGDLVRRDEEGYFFVSGRKKDMYKSGGENVYPVEIESVISQMGGVREVAVIGVPDPKWGEVGKAFLVLDGQTPPEISEIRAHCERNLARFKVPKYLIVVPSLPKGDSGKILKKTLSECETRAPVKEIDSRTQATQTI